MAINCILLTRRWLQASAGPLSAVKSVISSPIVFLYYSARYSAFGRDLGSAMALGCNDGSNSALLIQPKADHCQGPATVYRLSLIRSVTAVSIVSAAQSVGHGGSAEANAKGVRFPLPRPPTYSQAGPDAIALEWSHWRRMVICSFYVIARTRPTKTPRPSGGHLIANNLAGYQPRRKPP